MRRLALLILTIFYTLPLVAQTKHPFTFEDMMSLKRVADPQPLPDRNWVT